MRPVTEVGDVRENVRTQSLHETKPSVADAADVNLLTLAPPFLVLVQHHAQQIGVERAAQALVGGDDDDADALDRVALHQERVAVLGVGMADVRRDVADLVGVGPRRAHPLLHLAHLGGRHHLHRLGDLPGVLHTPDLHSNFFGAWHKVPFLPPTFARVSAGGKFARKRFV